MGLLTMSRRARMVGGELSVANHPLGGTLITCSVPIPLPSQPQRTETA
jgi:signal transduction histidine kinase